MEFGDFFAVIFAGARYFTPQQRPRLTIARIGVPRMKDEVLHFFATIFLPTRRPKSALGLHPSSFIPYPRYCHARPAGIHLPVNGPPGSGFHLPSAVPYGLARTTVYPSGSRSQNSQWFGPPLPSPS